MKVYLDNNATTQPLPEVVEAVAASLTTGWGNPSSTHGYGERARGELAQAREAVARLAGVSPEDTIFTSGGTESNRLAFELAGLNVPNESAKGIAISTVEHSSVMRLADQYEACGKLVHRIGVDEQGLLRIDELKHSLEAGCALVSIQWVNSETGVVQPIAIIAELCRANGTLLHVDAAQGIGRMAPLEGESAPDMLSWSGHKLHAPKGVGVLALGPRIQINREVDSQELGLRSGTENLPGIIGLARANQMRRESLTADIERMTALRDILECLIKNDCPNIRVNGGGAERVCGTTNLTFPEVQGPAFVNRLELAGIYCSQTSACLRGRPEPSYVLTEMSVSEEDAAASVRFSVSVLNTEEEIKHAAAVITKEYKAIRRANQKLLGIS